VHRIGHPLRESSWLALPVELGRRFASMLAAGAVDPPRIMAPGLSRRLPARRSLAPLDSTAPLATGAPGQDAAPPGDAALGKPDD